MPMRLRARRSFGKVPLDSRAVSDVFMLAMGAYTPLDGFMSHDDWRGACVDMKLGNGVFWPIPITLSATKDVADSINPAEEVALTDAETGKILAIMQVGEKYAIDKKLEAEHVYRTTDPKHPGVAKVLQQGAGESGRARLGSQRRRISRANILTSISGPPSRGRCFLSGAGPPSRLSRPEIRCTAATNIW